MLDSLLIVEGETADRFAVTLAFDEPYPMRTALDVQQPLLTERVSKSTSSCAWILGLTAKNVQIAWTRCEDQKLILLLEETDGRAAACHMRTAQKVAEARERRATGTSVSSLEVTPTGIALKFRAFEIKEVELTF